MSFLGFASLSCLPACLALPCCQLVVWKETKNVSPKPNIIIFFTTSLTSRKKKHKILSIHVTKRLRLKNKSVEILAEISWKIASSLLMNYKNIGKNYCILSIIAKQYLRPKCFGHYPQKLSWSILHQNLWSETCKK